MAFLHLEEQVTEAARMARRTVSAERLEKVQQWETQMEGLKRTQRDWELEHEELEKEREAFQEECDQQRRLFQAEMDKEREALRRQYLQDLTVQDKVIEQSRIDLQHQRECVKALQTQSEAAVKAQRAERERIQRERDALELRRIAMACREQELLERE
uniref:Uncharacterized protein n=1 Tax=Sphaerodactylus townsendi TaxID=933632 RepID=A0ACB8EUJ2_9SAUR